MTFDPGSLGRLGGQRRRDPGPARIGVLLRVGAGAGLAAALCDVALLLVFRAFGWDTSVGGAAIQPFGVLGACLLVGVLAGLGAYVAARVTRHPAAWVGVLGSGLYAASLQDLPPAVLAMHTVTALWVVGWLAAAVRGGSHLR